MTNSNSSSRKGKVIKFVECDTCRAKPGSPLLCYGCLKNRDTITNFLSERDRFVKAFMLIDKADGGERIIYSNVGKDIGLYTISNKRADCNRRRKLLMREIAETTKIVPIFISFSAPKKEKRVSQTPSKTTKK